MDSQSQRLEKELADFRKIFADARDGESPDPSLMLKIGNIIERYEKQIAKARVEEGLMLSRRDYNKICTQLVDRMVEVAKDYVPEDQYESFIDDIIVAGSF